VLRKAAGADETGAALAKALKMLSTSAPAPGGEQAAESALRAK
jgi:hypothetical protein